MPRSGGPVVFKTDFDKNVILATFDRLGWQRARGDDEEDWDVYWASVHNVRQLFNPESGRRLAEHQLVNHFPNHQELTRKDLMARNIKRYRKEREKLMELAPDVSAPALAPREEYELPAEWVPTTFALPNDYALFVEEFRRNPNAAWIAKPTGKAQGRGIFLVSKLQQLKKWSGGNQRANPSQTAMPFRGEPYIISRYVADPLLIGGKKFDMRLYVLVTSYRPLKVFLYRGGFCRFCVEQYSSDVAEIDNIFVHLTNVAIQRQAEDYNDRHGGKWSIDDLMLFIESTRGKAARERVISDMEALIVHSLKAVQGVMINDRHCFEMYGFDILIDRNLKPWLIEVNASPSLSTTTEEDRILKMRVIHDTLCTVMALAQERGSPDAAAADPDDVGGGAVGDYVCLLDEARQRTTREEDRRAVRDSRRRQPPPLQRPGRGWR